VLYGNSMEEAREWLAEVAPVEYDSAYEEYPDTAEEGGSDAESVDILRRLLTLRSADSSE